ANADGPDVDERLGDEIVPQAHGVDCSRFLLGRKWGVTLTFTQMRVVVDADSMLAGEEAVSDHAISGNGYGGPAIDMLDDAVEAYDRLVVVSAVAKLVELIEIVVGRSAGERARTCAGDDANR